MAARTPTNPTTKVWTYRLAQLKEKMATLRQEEEKICQTLAQNLAQCLINAQALEIDYDTLIGGILEIVNQAQASTPKPSLEQTRRMEVWKKSGEKFRRNRGHNKRNKRGGKEERQEKQQADKQGSNQPEQPAHQHPSPTIPKAEKVAEKVMQAEGKNKPHTHFPITSSDDDESKN